MTNHAGHSTAAHDDHGSTPAAWTAVTIIMIASVVSTVGIIIGQWPVFWVGIALVAVGGIAGKVLQLAGFGKNGRGGKAQKTPVAAS